MGIATCIYCGYAIAHGDHGSTSTGQAYQQLIEHDRQCPKNPLVARIKELEAKLIKEDISHDNTIEQRDTAESAADNLAHAIMGITGRDIGEHSSAHCPWTAALEHAEEFEAERHYRYDLTAHMERQIAFSTRAFGPGDRTQGVIDHIRKELLEIESAPDDLEEWIDVVLLALDGAWRAGYSPDQVTSALEGKLHKNEQRKWPDWRTVDRTKAIEHDRATEGQGGQG
ncbi:MAG: dATP/dGTP pyrophosphohydrolase domain-containing protein [Pseudomonadota bacterium]